MFADSFSLLIKWSLQRWFSNKNKISFSTSLEVHFIINVNDDKTWQSFCYKEYLNEWMSIKVVIYPQWVLFGLFFTSLSPGSPAPHSKGFGMSIEIYRHTKSANQMFFSFNDFKIRNILLSAFYLRRWGAHNPSYELLRDIQKVEK